MPFCGIQKSKRIRRDLSPPFSARQIEETKEQADREVQKAKANQERVEGELKEIKREKVRLQEENSNVKKTQEQQASEIEKLKAKLKDLETKDSAQAEKADTVELGTKLQEITVQINEERQQKKEFSTAKEQLQNELARANKTLETERNQRTKVETERDKYKREKEVAERNLNLTRQELEEIKKESNGPSSSAREPNEEWQAKIKQAESALTQERNQRLEKERELSSLQNNMENMKQTYENKVSKYERENISLKQKLQETEGEKDKLRTRLSAITAAQVKENNPNFSDLSDPNRPEKLGEQMSLLYDDQWTDATEALADLSMDDNAVVKTLLDVLIDIYEHCKEAAEEQLSRIEEDMFLPPIEGQGPISPDANGTDHQPKSPPPSKAHSASKIPRLHSQKARPGLSSITSPDRKENDLPDFSKSQKSKKNMTFPRGKGEKVPDVPVDIKRGIKDYRKTVSKQVIPVIEKEITNKLRNKLDMGNDVVDKCKNYITRCVELCWLMCIQDPPCVLNWSFPEDRVFDTDVYRYYLTTGKQLDYVVWPAMHLFEGGPLIMKGVAEGKKV